MMHYETHDDPSSEPDLPLFGGGYENAPACKMLATTCAVCRRPLLDAKSVETGMGPECRKKHGYNHPCTPAEREAANKLVHAIAAGNDGPDAAAKCAELKGLGFVKLADRIMDRLAVVTITRDPDGRLAVKTPYSPEMVEAMRRIPGRKWDMSRKINVFPHSARRDIYTALQAVYLGGIGIGPDGNHFIIKK